MKQRGDKSQRGSFSLKATTLRENDVRKQKDFRCNWFCCYGYHAETQTADQDC